MSFHTDPIPNPDQPSEPNKPDNRLSIVISCDTCVMRTTDACSDCMMGVLLDTAHDGAVVLDLQEQRALRLLAQAGLVPTLRHRAAG